MIELSNMNAQVLAAGQSVTFDTVLLHTGCAECHRSNSSVINLTQRNAIYEISYNANIGTVAAGTGEISVTIDGDTLGGTTAIVNTITAGNLTNVSASRWLKTCCCRVPNSVLLTNTGTTDINIGEKPRFSIKRIA